MREFWQGLSRNGKIGVVAAGVVAVGIIGGALDSGESADGSAIEAGFLPVITEADQWDIVSAESGIWAGDDVESMFPAHIVAAAKRRYEFSRDYGDGAWWQDLIGAETFGYISLELDGTVTIKYLGKEPDLSILPAQFEYKFVPTDKTNLYDGGSSRGGGSGSGSFAPVLGSAVYSRIAALTDCGALHAEFDTAADHHDRTGDRWSIEYMEAADDRMQAIGCYDLDGSL